MRLTGANDMKLFAKTQVPREGVSNMRSNLSLKQLWMVLIVGAVCLVLAATGFAQGIATGSISGMVTDPSGSVVMGAKVTAQSTSTNQTFSGTTTELGLFAMRAVPPGVYKVTIEAKGFRTVVLDNVEVLVARETALN